jgi:hypothetical protein
VATSQNSQSPRYSRVEFFVVASLLSRLMPAT